MKKLDYEYVETHRCSDVIPSTVSSIFSNVSDAANIL